MPHVRCSMSDARVLRRGRSEYAGLLVAAVSASNLLLGIHCLARGSREGQPKVVVNDAAFPNKHKHPSRIGFHFWPGPNPAIRVSYHVRALSPKTRRRRRWFVLVGCQAYHSRRKITGVKPETTHCRGIGSELCRRSAQGTKWDAPQLDA
jgi:hypothetical protein